MWLEISFVSSYAALDLQACNLNLNFQPFSKFHCCGGWVNSLELKIMFCGLKNTHEQQTVSWNYLPFNCCSDIHLLMSPINWTLKNCLNGHHFFITAFKRVVTRWRECSYQLILYVTYLALKEQCMHAPVLCTCVVHLALILFISWFCPLS